MKQNNNNRAETLCRETTTSSGKINEMDSAANSEHSGIRVTNQPSEKNIAGACLHASDIKFDCETFALFSSDSTTSACSTMPALFSAKNVTRMLKKAVAFGMYNPASVLRNSLLAIIAASSATAFAEALEKSSLHENYRETAGIGRSGMIQGNGLISDSIANDPAEFEQHIFNADTGDGGKPAWEQNALREYEFSKLLPFGSDLFKGNFSSTYQTGINADYRISTGDQIAVRIWGAKTYEDVLTVDLQGNIFIPQIGPIAVAELPNSQLLSTIRSKVSTVFTNDVEVYVNLQTSQPVAVFVTGFVNKPGRYAGTGDDNVLSFIDRAGGIDGKQGSYRKIVIKRGNSILANIDLYDFLLQGNLPSIRLKNNDVILIEPRESAVHAYGMIRHAATYEMKGSSWSGEEFIKVTGLMPQVTHAQITGVRSQTPFNVYLSLSEFRKFTLKDNDKVMLVADKQRETIVASVIGAIDGRSKFIVRKGTTLKDVLEHTHINTAIADTNSVYVRRQSVARQQKIIIEDALKRLEQSALTAESSSVDEANIRVKEAELIQDFVKRAQQAKPDGVIVVSSNGKMSNLALEDGDEIIIPEHSDVVHVGGEVLMPKALVWNQEYKLQNYIEMAGGYSDRADEDTVLIVHPNGEVGGYKKLGITPGSRIVVLPEVDTKAMQFGKDLMQIIYQIAVATKVVIDL